METTLPIRRTKSAWGTTIRMLLFVSLLCAGTISAFAAKASPKDGPPWWDKAWSGRKQFVVDTSSDGGNIEGSVGEPVVLIRLHQGNFSFNTATEDGSDLRFVGPDNETLLPFHIEKWDTLMLEGFVWVRAPEIEPGGKAEFWMYFGNPAPPADSAPNSHATYPEDIALVYHFSERGSPPQDATANRNNAVGAGTQSEGAIIAAGLRLLGADPIEIPATETLEWTGNWSWSAWVKPTSIDSNEVLLSRIEGQRIFRIGIDRGTPYVEIRDGGSPVRLAAEAPIGAGGWTNIATTFTAPNVLRLYVNGEEVAEASSALPSIAGSFFLGGDAPGAGTTTARFVGEMDEMQIAKAALPPGAVSFAALNQSGSDRAARLLQPGEEEGGGGHAHNETLEHVMLFGDIASNMMFDGWIAVGVCILMIIVGWSVGVAKFFYLIKLERGNTIFFKLWKEVTRDMNLLDENKEDQLVVLARKMPKKNQVELKHSPLYHIYHSGLEEIESRLGRKAKVRMDGLSARSMQAIRASMDAGLVHENQRLNSGLVFLTIGIAGGPYVGLLGTVVGVMITFALIAKTGEVEVNSIAPGIASALLATVAGLVVAIPALFIYSYLSTRIKNTLSSMEVFIDDFVAKIAEFYPPPSEKNFVPVPEVELPEPPHHHARGPAAPGVLSDGAPGEVPPQPSIEPRKH